MKGGPVLFYFLFCLTLAIFLTAYVQCSIAGEIHIHPGSSIQAAINGAYDGDVIIVHPGIYYENINFLGKSIIVKSTNPDNQDIVNTTIIDGSLLTSVIKFNSGESYDSQLIGFTIKNGRADYGGGIHCSSSFPIIKRCTIINNEAFFGGGICCIDSFPIIDSCIVKENKVFAFGGGIYCDNSFPSIIDCSVNYNNAASYGGGIYFNSCLFKPTIKRGKILGNKANSGSGIMCSDVSCEIINCIIANNEAERDGGIYCFNSSSRIKNCSVVGNLAKEVSGGIIGLSSLFLGPKIKNSIIWNNSLEEIYDYDTGYAEVSYSNVEGGYTGKGNINQDPLFINSEQGDYHLKNISPCIDKGANEDSPEEDFDRISRPQDGDGDGIAKWDMGAYEYLIPPPKANFSIDPNNGISPLIVSFNDYSTGEINSWLWDFGDGSTSHFQNPTYTYNYPGIYTVSLTVSGPGGSDIKTTYIRVKLLITVITDNGGTIEPNEDVILDYGASQTFTIIPDMGYQITDVIIDSNSMGPIFNHTFSNLTSNHDIYVIFNPDILPPIADAGSDQTVNEGNTVTLNGEMSDDIGGIIISYQWMQTDGIPSITFSNPNDMITTFVAGPVNTTETILKFQFTVKDSGGNYSSDEISIKIIDNGIAGFPNDIITTKCSTGKDIGIKLDSPGSIVSLTPIDPSGIIDTINRPENMIYGLFDFKIKVNTPGDIAVVTFYLPSSAQENYIWFKYDMFKGWHDCKEYSVFNSDRTEITLTLIDGGKGDDGIKDGIINDLSGLGILPSSESFSNGGGGGGGCWINSISK